MKIDWRGFAGARRRVVLVLVAVAAYLTLQVRGGGRRGSRAFRDSVAPTPDGSAQSGDAPVRSAMNRNLGMRGRPAADEACRFSPARPLPGPTG